jgi:putative hydrolase of the HAD superfamily
MTHFDLLAFDADDTLWQNERLYWEVQAKFVELLAQYHSEDWIRERLYQAEMRNLEHFGYGVKAFALSMIETAIELTERRISGQDLQGLVELAKGMLRGKPELLEYAEETLHLLKGKYPLMLLTKGDLFEQEGKIARSGLAGCFRDIEIVSQKTALVYRSLLEKRSIAPGRFLMVGNALRSDIWPVLDIGGHAVYIPHELTWQHEHADPPPLDHPGFYQLAALRDLPGLLEQIESDQR